MAAVVGWISFISFQDKLLEHEKVHSEYTFPCVKCSKTFHTNDALKHHLPLHEVIIASGGSLVGDACNFVTTYHISYVTVS